MINEDQIENAFVAYAEANNCEAKKLRIDGRNGFPDRTVITSKGIFFAEFKRRDGKLRPAQRKEIKRLRELGYTVLTPRRIGEAEAFLDQFLSVK